MADKVDTPRDVFGLLFVLLLSDGKEDRTSYFE